MPSKPALHLALDDSADALLSRDPFALLVGMLLDQQIPMERAFGGPALIAERMNTPKRLDPQLIADIDPDEFAKVMSGPPAVHRFPGSMGKRVQALATVIAEEYDGDAAAIWSDVPDGKTLVARLQSLPGFGAQKAKIFAALLGKQLNVQPKGWRAATGDYGKAGSHRSIADVTGPESLAKVRAFKQAMKQAAKDGK
jgi:uncharacterized HhH-GPD family protein